MHYLLGRNTAEERRWNTSMNVAYGHACGRACGGGVYQSDAIAIRVKKEKF